MKLFSMRHHDAGGHRGASGARGGEREVPIVERSTGEHVTDQRIVDRRSSDRAAHDVLEQLKTATITPKSIMMIAALWVVVNQGINWWRESRVDPIAYRTHVAAVDAMRDEVTDMRSDFDSLVRVLNTKIQGDLLTNYAICQQFKRNFDRGLTNSYPRFCTSPEITRFETDVISRDSALRRPR